MCKRSDWQNALERANESLAKHNYSILITGDKDGFYTCDILKDGVKTETYAENYYEDELECLIEDAKIFILLHRIGNDKVKIRIASEICNMLNNNIILRNGNETFKGWCEDGDIFAGDENEEELIALMEQVCQYVDKITYDYLMTY